MPRPPRSRAPLLDAALRLFAERGIDGTTIREIARAAGCSEAAIYSHWASKEALVHTLYEGHLAAVCSSLDDAIGRTDALDDQISAAVHALLRLFDEHPLVFRFVLLARHDVDLARNLQVRTPLDVVQELVHRVRPDLGPQESPILTASLVGLVLESAMFVLYGRITAPLAGHGPRISALALRLLRA